MNDSPPSRVSTGTPIALALASALLAAAAAQAAPAPAPGPDSAVSLQEVVVTGKALQLKSLKQKSIFESAYGDKALDRQQLKSAGVVGGAAQALSFAPGINVEGYGQTGGTKATISMNGFKQGWGGFSGNTIDNGSIAIGFDGIPMGDPITGLWETPEVPQTALLQGARVTYGPGDPESRWVNNIGGGVNFVPVQPASQSGGYAQLTYGSFSTENADLILQTGKIDGWETVIAGGAGRSSGFRTSPDGFNWPTRNFAGFFKTRKVFSRGDVSFGAYLGDGHGWRPTPIPLAANPLITVNGMNANNEPVPGPLYSEQTSGFYSAVNEHVWRKDDYNRVWLIYSRQNIRLDRRIILHNQLWYRQGDRLHVHYNNWVPGAGNLYEHNNPTAHDYGDKIWSDLNLPYDTVSVGGYFINALYNSRNSFYNPAVCATTATNIFYGYNQTEIPAGTGVCGSAAVPNATHRSDFWYTTFLSAFVQDEISPVASLTITPGIRAVSFSTDYYPYGSTYFAESDALSQPTLAAPTGAAVFGGHDQGELPATHTNYDETEPSVSLRWQPLHWLAAYGNWASAYRLPQVGGGGGLYQSVPAIGDILEKSLEWQAGVKAFWPEAGDFTKVLFNVNYYHTHFSNQFIGATQSATGVFLGEGVGDSLYHGVNLSGEANLGTLKMFANLNLEKAYFSHYTFHPVQGESAAFSYNGAPVSNVPDTTFNIGAYWTRTLPGGIVLKPRAWYQYVGKQYLWSNFLSAPTNREQPSFGVLNLALAAALPSSWYGDAVKSVKLKVEVMNALDKQYNEFEEISGGGIYATSSVPGATSAAPYVNYLLAYPGAPRAVYGTISVSF